VVVQYQQVNVSDGGQALVAGKESRGSRSAGPDTEKIPLNPMEGAPT